MVGAVKATGVASTDARSKGKLCAFLKSHCRQGQGLYHHHFWCRTLLAYYGWSVIHRL